MFLLCLKSYSVTLKLLWLISDIKQYTLEKSFNNVFTIKIFFSNQLRKEIFFQRS